MLLKKLGSEPNSVNLSYSSGNRTKVTWEKWSNVPSKLRRSEEVIFIDDESIKKRLNVDCLSPLFETGVQSALHPHHKLYLKFLKEACN
jgi:hypothetical protein